MSAQETIIDANPQNFQDAVVERSRQTPVLVLFWAEQVPPAAAMRAQLETLVGGYQGKVLLALVDVARDQTLAQHLRVPGLPSIRVIHNGQIADQLDGPQEESVLRELLDKLTMSSGDMVRQALAGMLEAGDLQAAAELLQQALQEEPNNAVFKVEMADLLVRLGDLDQARALLAALAEDADDRIRPQTRLEMVEEAAAFAELPQLLARLEAEDADLELHYQTAIAAAAVDQCELALEHAMLILQRDRKFRDDLGRTTMIRVFNLLGKGSDVAMRYRRRMFNFMH